MPETFSLAIQGSVSDKSRAIEQEVAYRFGDNLRQDERFSAAFTSIEPSVEAPTSSESIPGSDAKKATTFTIKCLSRKERIGG